MTAADNEHADETTPYADLNPTVVLDALDGVGLRGDGRLIQLNSYENRVFQVFLEDGRVVVAKFYRPGRWSDAQILEEHGFAAELAAAEIPVGAPLALQGAADSVHAADVSLPASTLARFESANGAYRFSVSERIHGRAPELEDPDTLEWIGRFVGRIHAVGARTKFQHRLTLDPATFGAANRDWLLAAGLIPPDALPDWRDVTARALDAVGDAFAHGGGARSLRLHGDCHLGNVLWSTDGPHFVDLDDAVNGPATQDLWMLLSGDRAAMSRQLAAVLDGYELHGLRLARAAPGRAAAHAAHHPSQRVDRAPLGRPGVPGRLPVVRRPGLLGRPDDAAARAARRDGRAAARQPEVTTTQRRLRPARLLTPFHARCGGIGAGGSGARAQAPFAVPKAVTDRGRVDEVTLRVPRWFPASVGRRTHARAACPRPGLGGRASPTGGKRTPGAFHVSRVARSAVGH